MKKWMFFIICVLAISCLSLISCGGGDSESSKVSGSNSGSIILGNLNSRKIKKMTIDSAGIYTADPNIIVNPPMRLNRYSVDETYDIEYDSEGRLSRVYKEKNDGNNEQILMIDYDFMLVRSSKLNIDTRFTLNEKGFISQIENCRLLYNDEGYLIKTERNGNLWTILYNNGELEKCLSELESGKTELFYYFGEDSNAGEMCFCYGWPFGEYASYITERQLIGFFAYQAGLFGKVVKHIRRLPESKDKRAEMNIKPEKNHIDERYRILLYASFIFE